jgi:hypothetical protein
MRPIRSAAPRPSCRSRRQDYRGGSWCGGNVVGESGRSQITFGEQKLQLHHTNFLVKIQLLVIIFEGSEFKNVSGRARLRAPGQRPIDTIQFGCRRRNAGMSRWSSSVTGGRRPCWSRAPADAR